MVTSRYTRTMRRNVWKVSSVRPDRSKGGCLIDEHDAPCWTWCEEKEPPKLRDVMRNFYSPLPAILTFRILDR